MDFIRTLQRLPESRYFSWQGLWQKLRPSWLTALAALALLISGTIIAVHAQAQTCRDIGNITVCADQLKDLSANGGGFKLSGNLRIGPKGQPAVVVVGNTGSVFDGTILSESITAASYFHFNQVDQFTGSADFIIGEVRMINDVTGLALLGTSVVANPANPGEVTAGRLFVDPVAQRIFLPAAGAVPVFTTRGVVRNTNYRLAFVSRVGALSFYKDGGTAGELSTVDAEFNLATKKFTSVVPINLKVGDTTSNPNLQIKMRAEFDIAGNFNGTVDGFSLNIGGLLLDASGIVVKPGSPNVAGAPQTTPVEFTAASVKALKSKNPKAPNLDPSDANLVFAFTNLKYKNGIWEIGGVEVPIKPWEFGPAFKMTNQTLGIINEANIQALQIKSTMEFGTGSSASKLPITMKIGRGLAGDGSVQPVFSAGLQDIKPKLGTFTFNLTGVSFVGDATQNFFGIQATTAAIQWPAHLGGQTAAAVSGFKLGMNSDKKLQFALGSGTIGLPTLRNNVFEGTLQATMGVVSETLTITGTGLLTLKLPGNANAAGVAVNAIMRYNKDVDASLQPTLSANQIAAQMRASGVDALRICFGPGNVPVTCPADPPPPPPSGPKAFELQLAGFSLKLAGFGLTIINPRSTDDGGFAADNVGFTLPGGLSTDGAFTGAAIQGLVVKGNGDISISGGGFEIAPLKIGEFKMVGLRGSFIKEANGNYAFTGGAKFPLPGIEPGTNGGGIGVEVTIRTNATTGAFAGAGVKVEINSPPLPPIPIGTTGMQITSFRGAFDLANGTATISVGVTVSTIASIPIGSTSLSLAKIDGDITVQINPFKFIGNAELTVLIFKVASATIRFGDGEGFGGDSGMNVTVNVNQVIMSGEFKMRYSKGTPEDPNKRRFTASAKWIFGIQKGQYGVGRPPFNLGGITANLSGGIFKDNNFNPARETIGMKASICAADGSPCIGTFLNLKASPGSGDFLDFIGLDKYVLIPAAAVRAAAARGEAGFAMRALNYDEIGALGLLVAADQLAAGIYEEVVDIPLTSTTTLLAGIDYLNGTPLVRLQMPNGVILTPTVKTITQTVLIDTQSITKSIYYVVSGAPVGTYKLLIDNASDYELVSYTINEQPKLAISNALCPGRPIPSAVTAQCVNPLIASEDAYLVEVDPAAIPDQGVEINSSTVSITWAGSDIDSPNATVDIGFVPDSGSKENVDIAAVNIVAEDLPLASGNYTFDFKESGSGKYRFVVIAKDGQNGPVFLASAAVISVTDPLAPAVPLSLTAVSQAGELLIKWEQNTENDLAGYELGFGVVNPNQPDLASNFVYTRNMGPKEVVTGTNSIIDAKIWGLADNSEVFYGIRAYDTSGNYSAWSTPQRAKPWALSPNTWEPIPNGVGNRGVVEIAFEVPMKFETLENKLVLKNGSGQVVEGTSYLLTNLNGEVIGVGIQPTEPFSGTASALLSGGSNGAQAADGRTMGGDYVWTFTLTTPEGLQPLIRNVYLPMVNR